MASIVEGAISNFTREELEKDISDFVAGADLTWKKIENQFIGLENQGIGRGWLYKTNLNLGTAGVVVSDTALEGTETGGTHAVQRTVPTFPGTEAYLSSNSAQISIRLVNFRGTIMLPLELLKSDKLNAVQASLVTMEVTNAAKKLAHRECTEFYLPNDYIEIISGSVTDGGTGDSSFTFTVSSTARPRDFIASTQIECWSSDGATRRHADNTTLDSANAEVAYVDSFSPTAGVVVVQLTTGTFDSQVVAGDKIYFMRPTSASGTDITASGNKPVRVHNPFAWTKSSGNIYGGEGQPTGFDVTKYGALASIVNDFGSTTTLAEKHLDQYFNEFADAFDSQLDHAVTTSKVLELYRQGRAGLAVEQRGGMISENRAGFGFFSWTGGGRKVEVMTSSQMRPGYFLGLKMRDKNIVRLVPPSLDRSGSDGRFPGRVEFVANIGGGNSIWRLRTASSGNVEARVEAPWMQSYNLFARDPRGLLLTNLAES